MTYKNKNKKNKGGNNISTILQNITNIIVLAVIFISLYFIIQFAEKINTTNQNIQEDLDSLNNGSRYNHPVNQNIFEGESLPSDEQTSFITAAKRQFDDWKTAAWEWTWGDLHKGGGRIGTFSRRNHRVGW